MPDLSTTYMGVPLRNPVVVAACSLSGMIADIQRLEEAGAGGLVIKSLFEEQIMRESADLSEELTLGAERYREAITYWPLLEHAGPRGHLMWIERTRQAVKMPLFASLNAMQPGTWVRYARELEATGIDGLELNVYAVQTDPKRSAADVEQELYETVEQVRSEVTIPVAVKLSPYYTSLPNVAAELDRRGVHALVLFNRFLQPDIDVEKEILWNRMNFSHADEMRLPLRWIAILYGRIRADLAASTGVHNSESVVKCLMAGAAIVQVATALYRHGIPCLRTMVEGLEAWMRSKGYGAIADFRGKLSQKDATDRFVFERAQYVDLLLKKEAPAESKEK